MRPFWTAALGLALVTSLFAGTAAWSEETVEETASEEEDTGKGAAHTDELLKNQRLTGG